MLNDSDYIGENKQEKIALLKYTYEQVLATQAEQINGKLNIDNITDFNKILENTNIIKNKKEERLKIF